jgi:endogenous inhibitor of DNA gyrase (YacG/DUF329 family)
MSADNWTTCPRCVDAVDKAEQYDSSTFREDYCFSGASEGVVTAEYRGYCTTCGLKVSFDHVVDFYPTPGAGSVSV